MRAKPTLVHWALCVLIFLGNVSLQLFVHGNALDNGVENRSSPSSTDSRDYTARAETLRTHGFAAAFGDGYRTPGYPVFLAAFHPFFNAPLQAARAAQILLTAAIVLFAFLTFVNLLGPGPKALIGTALVACWAPLYYFSPLLLAEAPSLFVLSVLLWALSRPSRPLAALPATPGPLGLNASDRASNTLSAAFRFTILVPILFTMLVALKPNHIVLFPALAAFLWMHPWRQSQTRSHAWVYAGLFTVLCIAMLAPWSVFVSTRTDKPVLLSSASSLNLYLGTGVVQKPEDAGTLPYRLAESRGMGFESRADAASPVESDKEAWYASRAGEIWRTHPWRTSLYGAAKVAHGFGFSLRGPRDVLLVLLLLASLFASVRLWRRSPADGAYRAWCAFFWIVLFVTSLQLFVYLPNQRLKTVLFDLPAWVILVLGIFAPGNKTEKSA